MTSQTSEKSTRILTTLKDILAAIMYAVEAGNLDEVLERIAYVTQELIQTRYAALAIPDRQGSLKVFKAVGLSPEEIRRIGRYPVGLGLLGAIMNERKVLRLEKIQDDSRSVGFPPHHPPMETLLGVPIQVGQQLFGMLYLCDRLDGQPFSEHDQWLVETLAGYAALAIAGAQLGDQQARLVLLEERERVAAELHDSTIQSLYAIGMQLQLLQLSQDVPNPSIGDVIHHIDNVITDIRHYIMDLKSKSYRQQTIYNCLNDVLSRLHIPQELHVELNAPDDYPPFSPAIFESICLIAHEAISNVVRHANAHHLQISVYQTTTDFEMIIEDDGRGFDPNMNSDHQGLGLHNMQKRARFYNGSVHIRTAPNCGTRLLLRIPHKTL